MTNSRARNRAFFTNAVGIPVVIAATSGARFTSLYPNVLVVDATETNVDLYLTTAQTFSRLACNITSNANNDTDEIFLRVDAATTTLFITITASTTGLYIEESVTLRVPKGSLLAFHMEAQNTGVWSSDCIQVMYS